MNVKKQFFLFDTIVSIQLEGENADNQMREVVKELYRLQGVFSFFDESSELSSINQQPLSWVKVSNEMIKVLAYASYMAQQTNGAFHPFLGNPLQQLRLDERPTTFLVDQDYIHYLSYKQHHVRLNKKGCSIDLGGIAKGYIAQCMECLLKDEQVNALFDFGGQILVLHQLSTSWIGIQDPKKPRNECLVYLEVAPYQCVVTSGVYERTYAYGQHILDASNKRSANHTYASISMIGPSNQSMCADALSTALMVMNKEDGLEFLETYFPDFSYIAIDNNNHITSNVKDLHQEVL